MSGLAAQDVDILGGLDARALQCLRFAYVRPLPSAAALGLLRTTPKFRARCCASQAGYWNLTPCPALPPHRRHAEFWSAFPSRKLGYTPCGAGLAGSAEKGCCNGTAGSMSPLYMFDDKDLATLANFSESRARLRALGHVPMIPGDAAGGRIAVLRVLRGRKTRDHHG